MSCTMTFSWYMKMVQWVTVYPLKNGMVILLPRSIVGSVRPTSFDSRRTKVSQNSLLSENNTRR